MMKPINIMTAVSVCFIIFLSMGCQKEKTTPAYKNPILTVEKRVEDLLKRMTLEEKIQQLSGVGFDTKANKRLGIPVLKMADGPVGVRWGNATAFPAAIGMAATWNPGLIEQIAGVMAEELKSKGRNYLLGPCVNIHRHPLGGRNFESYGEDPFLAARMAVAFIKGAQSKNILACVKHFVLNNQEWERHKVDVSIDERGLREIYLPAFKAAVKEAGVKSVMAAYNRFRGLNCSESKYLLDDILKKEWGFQGVVVSDWDSTYSTIHAANAGLDLEMPWGKFFGEKLLQAVKNGKVSLETIDDKVKRLLRVRFELNFFDRPVTTDETVITREAHKKLALRAAKESMVLLKNKNNILPLHKKKIKSIAVIGPNAAEARVGGGGSSKVMPLYAISPLKGLQESFGPAVTIKFALGIAIRGDIHPLNPEFMVQTAETGEIKGLKGEYFPNTKLEGKPVMTRTDDSVNFNWGYDAPHPKLHRVDDRNLFSIKWTGKLLPPKTGVYKLNVIHNDGFRLYLDKKLLIDNWKKNRIVFKTVSIPLEVGKRYDIRMEYFFDGGVSLVKFGWQLPDHDYMAEAVKLAKESDVVIVLAGLHERFESEAHDKPRLELKNQDILINAVAAANPHTVVVMETGSPVLMNPWINDVAAVLQAWYPGQEGGKAIADILTGETNPSGKLPFSMIDSYEQSPAFKGYRDKNLKSHYHEGLFVGYRYLDKQGMKPHFPFGHGLSYTRFHYGNLEIKPLNQGEFSYEVSLDIENKGERAGAEVVQLYVRDIESRLPRPEKELKGFKKVFLEPGEKQRVTLQLTHDSFAFYDPQQTKWTVESGEFEIRLGSSSGDIRLKTNLSITRL